MSKYIDLQELRKLIAFQAQQACAKEGMENVVIDVRIDPPGNKQRRVEVLVREDIDPTVQPLSKHWEDN